MTFTPATPSQIARSVAASLWPDVQRQTKVASGTFGFSCSGHGGIVGVIDSLPTDVSEADIQAARDAGLIETVLVCHGRRKRIYSTATGLSREGLLQNADNPWAEIREVWVGEEDCDWATLVLASDTISTGAAGKYLSGTSETVQAVAAETAERWCSTFLAARV
jgi:hypothetical protein